METEETTSKVVSEVGDGELGLKRQSPDSGRTTLQVYRERYIMALFDKIERNFASVVILVGLAKF